MAKELSAVDTGAGVVVTTGHRGVFFGYVRSSKLPEWIELDKVRMCVSWSSSMRGVLGLAESGPNSECRISPDTPHGKLWNITGVFACTDAAVSRWEAAPWRQ